MPPTGLPLADVAFGSLFHRLSVPHLAHEPATRATTRVRWQTGSSRLQKRYAWDPPNDPPKHCAPYSASRPTRARDQAAERRRCVV